MLTDVPSLTKEQAAIIGAYTGIACGPFGDVREYVEKKTGQMLTDTAMIVMNVKAIAKEDFLAICYQGKVGE